MFTLRGSIWGPVALPDLLRAQLTAHGFTPEDAGRCARLINEHHGGAATASLFVDLGSCKFLEADIDGAIAAWRHAIASPHDAAAARAMLNLGLLFEHLHLHERALGLLARVAERNVEPYVIAAAMASARSQVALGQAENAMETMARLAQMVMARRPDGDDLIEALYGLGEVAEHAGRFDRAERAWRVAAVSPASRLQQEAVTRLVQLQLAHGRSHAVDVPQTTLESGGQNTLPVLLDIAELFLRTGEKRQAAQLLHTIDSGDFAAIDRFRYVDASLMAGRINEAIDELETLLGADDSQVRNRALCSLGRVYASYDMIDPAVSMFQRAVASDDPYWMPAASLALGDVLSTRGDRTSANEYWSYAAGGSIPNLADQARARIEAATQATAVAAVGLAVELPELDASDMDGSELDGSELDFWDDASRAEAVEPEPEPTKVQAEPRDVKPAEPHLILLDSIDVEPSSSASDIEVVDTDGRDGIGAEAAELQPPEWVEPEPVLVVLDDLEDHADDEQSLGIIIDLKNESMRRDAASSSRRPIAASAFADYTDEGAVPNPYAALAPDGDAADVAPTTRNPYAELAPNFAADDFEPPANVEPGDWESMLGSSPTDEPAKSKKRPSAFSRYT